MGNIPYNDIKGLLTDSDGYGISDIFKMMILIIICIIILIVASNSSSSGSQLCHNLSNNKYVTIEQYKHCKELNITLSAHIKE